MADPSNPLDLPAEDPSGELGHEAWAIFREIAEAGYAIRQSPDSAARFQRYYKEELDAIEKPDTLEGVAEFVFAYGQLMAEFYAGITMRAVAKYLADQKT